MEEQELSESQEMYLKAIYLLVQETHGARVRDIAKNLGVNMPSVTSALKHLAAVGLIHYKPYEMVRMTEKGEATAQDIMNKYQTLKNFFQGVLGIEEKTAESEACQMEHKISQEVFHRLLRFVEYYQSCPYEKVHWNPQAQIFCTLDEEKCRGCTMRKVP